MEQTMGKRIAEHRKRLMLTQDQLAEQLGVTAQAVSKWENDQSCPDISILPKLAEIFGTTTDELLGIKQAEAIPNAEFVHEAEVINTSAESDETGDGNWEFHFNGRRLYSIGFPFFVLTVGVLYLLSQLLQWKLSFWDILWPTGIFIFGLWGLFDGFSFFRMACALFGGYTLADKLFDFSFDINGNLIWAVLIVMFGISLLVDALKKPKWSKYVHFGKKEAKLNSKHYKCTQDTFTMNGSFGDVRQKVALNILRKGEVNVSFGDYTIDLSEVVSVSSDCCIRSNCSFGELVILVPKRFFVDVKRNTTFADLTIKGHPSTQPDGTIQLLGNCSFGETTIKYI